MSGIVNTAESIGGNELITSLPIILLMLIFLCFSAFFSGSETALFSLNKMQISSLRNRYPRLSRAVVRLLRSPNNTLTSILLGNTLVNIGAALCASLLADKFLAQSPVISFFIGAGAITVIILLFGEITPKSVAISRAEILSLTLAQLLFLWSKIISPFRSIIHLITEMVLRFFSVTPANKITTLTEEELKILLSTSQLDNILPKDEQQMIAGVLELAETTVEDVMTPRTEIEAYPLESDRQLLGEALKLSEHNRVIIYNQNIDNVVGVLHVKDFFLNPDKPLPELIREPVFVPPKKNLIDMLADFRRKHIHLAVVVDEFGGVVGVITFQDILEEIVWELEETAKKAEAFIKKIGDREFIVAGNTEIWRVNEELGLKLSEETARTIAGFIINTLGGFPEVDEGIIVDNVRLTVAQKTRRRITQVKITFTTPTPKPSEDKNYQDNAL